MRKCARVGWADTCQTYTSNPSYAYCDSCWKEVVERWIEKQQAIENRLPQNR